MPDFIHLRLHTEYSRVDGLVRINPLLQRVVELGMPAVAVSDQSNFFGLVKFYRAALAAGVKPLFATDVLVHVGGERNNTAALCLLAADRRGYDNLIKLISRAWMEGQHLGVALIERDWLPKYAAGVIALSGGRSGDIGQALLSSRPGVAAECLQFWMQTFPERFYMELQRTGRENEEEYLHAAVELALAVDCPVVATNDVRFLTAGEFEAHEVRVCIQAGRTLDDPRRPRPYSEQQYLKSAQEMCELFSDIPEALENSVEIARRCNVTLELGRPQLPNFPVPAGQTPDAYFEKLSHHSLEQRLTQLFDVQAEDFKEREQRYCERLDFELGVIKQMGFSGYFLIVMDFIRWARARGIPVGPGRGSGSGSLVAYALGITDLDPLEYDLLFERFLNPERVSLPDFDVDFCMEKRDEVIHYVQETYGREAVCQIVTFGAMAAKGVVRDVARVQGKSYGLADKLSKLIPFELDMTLAKALAAEEPLRDFLAENPAAQEIWDMAEQLEGLTRNVGRHAGGVVIAPSRLTDFLPLYCDESGAGLVTQYDMKDVEDVGLVKFDFLGLRTLTIIDWALQTINRQRAGQAEPPIDIGRIPLDDKASYELLQRAETTALFQLESRGMKDLIKRLAPDCFADMVALLALFRPGPLRSGMVDNFVDRKHGREAVSYPDAKYQHPWLKPILEPTYGIILYQEQVMQIAQKLAGYTLGGADLLRRAMGKKKPEEMARQREVFERGAAGQGVDTRLALKIFDLLEKFAEYGFNKSHSTAYALLAYQTSWLKAHYPAPFMAAVLSTELQNTDKIVTLIDECHAMKLPLKHPDVNAGEYRFTVNREGWIVYGLGAIKGLGAGPVDNILRARREGGRFVSLFDFCARTNPRKVNRRALEALIHCGAFDQLGEDRALLLASLDDALLAAEQQASNEDAGMEDMFGEVISAAGDADIYARFRHVLPWSARETLAGEKETLGLWITGHPYDEYQEELRQLARVRLADLREDPSRNQTVAGLVESIRIRKTRTGDSMANLSLDDGSARIEVTVFADVYKENRELLVKDAIVIIEGSVTIDDYSGGLSIRANSVRGLPQARETLARELTIELREEQVNESLARQLEDLLQRAKGNCAVSFCYRRAENRARIRLGERWRVVPNDELLQGLRKVCGARNVALSYRPPV